MKKVCSINATWIFALMLILPGSILHAEDPPSTRDQAVREGQPVSTAPVPPALRQALASSLSKAVSIGAKSIPTPPTGSWGIVSEGDGGGGIFRDSNSDAEAWLGAEQVGVHGFGALAGGHFEDSDATGYAWVGHSDAGIEAGGSLAGGLFVDSDDDGEAWVGHGNFGIEARGSEMGGYFEDRDGSGFAHLGWGNTGVFGRGNVAGGAFDDRDGSGYARVGYGDRGVDAGGNEMGGYFEDSDGTGYAKVGFGDRGIEAYGDDMGGYFEDSDGAGYAYVGYNAWGINAYGDYAGGYFEDTDDSARAWVGYADTGIVGLASYRGGDFSTTSTGTYSHLATGPYSINGNGTKAFVQNHPYDRDSVIVYAALEGDEVATYTRGTAKIVGGEATVPLGETFKWVTNPDIGLTAHLTPRGEPIPLAVVDLSTEEMTVRAPGDAPDDLVFDYIVYGLRIGFEETSVVQEKEIEAYIPSMANHRQLYERRPDLKSYNSLERFKGMDHAVSPKAKFDLSRAQALRDAIIEFDPAVHELPKRPEHGERPGDDSASEEVHRGAMQAHERVRAARGDHDRRPATDQSDLSAAVPMDDEGNIYAPSFRPSSQDLASLVTVSEIVEPGDVLVIDRSSVGMMRRGSESHDTGVIGVVTAGAGVVLETQPLFASEAGTAAEESHRAAVALAGVVRCKVDAAYGAIWPGDLLVTSPTRGHAMRTDAPLPGTTLGKALEPLEEGTGTIRVLVMLR